MRVLLSQTLSLLIHNVISKRSCFEGVGFEGIGLKFILGFVFSRLLLIVLFSYTICVQANPAEAVYAEYSESIVQVKIVEVNAESQSSLGTGFFVGDGNLLATNYHVVSSVAMEPEKYRIEIEFQDEKHLLEILFVDVVNDLAVLKSPVEGKPLILAEKVPTKGSTLYSIGNPLDLGMTLVEGNYNGLVADRFFDQIHFAGAINSGMSGGPTLSEKGEVVGINVASAGNQVGFLVPVRFLRDLVARIDEVQSDADLFEDITRQINEATSYMIDRLLDEEWPKDNIGEAVAIGQLDPAVECWGDSHKDEETKLNVISKGCKNRESIFISHVFLTGFIEYEYHYHEGEGWPSTSLYRFMSNSAGNARPGNRASKEYVGNYKCMEELVQASEKNLKAKVMYCVRPYLKFHDLFDVLYMAVSLDKPDKSILAHYTLAGVTKKNADRFLERFMTELSWQ